MALPALSSSILKSTSAFEPLTGLAPKPVGEASASLVTVTTFRELSPTSPTSSSTKAPSPEESFVPFILAFLVPSLVIVVLIILCIVLIRRRAGLRERWRKQKRRWRGKDEDKRKLLEESIRLEKEREPSSQHEEYP
ncbi:hypothetical protein CPB86DRAFT_801189 [Serendipita vermifera]|nr:hypothetical protein CPB86DRAFT_801189 [Serendipita vermifera]